ncbi:MAG TPA: hypothetical protein VED63_08725, partial [Acidimicrobiales bacterium]|nr:hypothetical protein [Acidimicrobiales bacterium]
GRSDPFMEVLTDGLPEPRHGHDDEQRAGPSIGPVECHGALTAVDGLVRIPNPVPRRSLCRDGAVGRHADVAV